MLKDNYSKYHTVYFLKSKSEVVGCFADYFNLIETQTGDKPKKVKTDNGTEELNESVNRLCSKGRNIHELSCPFTPEQNSRIKREMHTLMEATTTVLIESQLDKPFWAEAMSYSAFTLN